MYLVPKWVKTIDMLILKYRKLHQSDKLFEFLFFQLKKKDEKRQNKKTEKKLKKKKP